MAERFFSKVANDVLQASEHLSNRLEEGVSAILTGEPPKEKQEAPNTGDDEEDEFEMIDEDLMNSPLEGIAESVMGDILQGQVRALYKRGVFFRTLLLCASRMFTHSVFAPLTPHLVASCFIGYWATNSNGTFPSISVCYHLV